jgi:hypothetical protein
MSDNNINVTAPIHAATKKGKLAAAKEVFLEGDTQTVEKEIQDINSRHNDLSSTVSEHTKQIETNQSQITANKSAQDEKNISLEENMRKLNTRDDQITETLKNISATGGASVASAVTYDNTTSKLTSANIQGAVDELHEKKFNKENIAQELGDSEDKVVSQKTLKDIISKTSNIVYTNNIEANKIIKELYIVFKNGSKYDYTNYNKISIYISRETSPKYKFGLYIEGEVGYTIEFNSENKPENGFLKLVSANSLVTLYALINWYDIEKLSNYRVDVKLTSFTVKEEFNPTIQRLISTPYFKNVGNFSSLDETVNYLNDNLTSDEKAKMSGLVICFYNNTYSRYECYMYNSVTNPGYQSNFINKDNWIKIISSKDIAFIKNIYDEVNTLPFVKSDSFAADIFFKEFYVINGDENSISFVKYVRIYRKKTNWEVIFYNDKEPVAKYSSESNPEKDGIIHIQKIGTNRQGSFEAYALVYWDTVEDETFTPYSDKVEFTNRIYDLNHSPSIRLYLEKNKIFYTLEKESYSNLLEALSSIPTSDRKKYMSICFFNEETKHKEIWNYVYTNDADYNYKNRFTDLNNWECAYVQDSILREESNTIGKYYYYISEKGALVRHYSMHSWYVKLANVEGASSVRLCGDVYTMQAKMPYAFYSSFTDFTEQTFITGGTPASNTNQSEEGACFDITVNVPSKAKVVAVLCRLYTPHIYVTRKHINYIEEIEKQRCNLQNIHSDIVLNNQKAQLLACTAATPEGSIDYREEGVLEKYFCFVQMSDSHGEFDKTERMIELLNSNAFNMVDVAIHTGDIVHFQFTNTGERNNLEGFQNLIKKSAKPFLFTVGNHDVYLSPTKNDSYNAWIKPMVDAGLLIEGVNVTPPNLYYYKDFEKYKIRYISLCDYEPIADGVWSIDHESVTQSQCDWLIDLLKSTPDNYTVFVGKHCPTVSAKMSDIGEWKDWNDTRNFNLKVKSRLDGDPLRDILYSYKNKTTLDKTYNYYNLDAVNTIPLPTDLQPIKISSSSGSHLADFSSAKGSLVTIVEGHYHGDVVYKGINYPNMIEVCNGGSAWRKSGERRRNDNGKSKDCFNLYVINTTKKKVFVIKIGCTVKSDFSECEITSFNY